MMRTLAFAALFVGGVLTAANADQERVITWAEGKVSAPIDLSVAPGADEETLRLFYGSLDVPFTTKDGSCYLAAIEGQICSAGGVRVEPLAGKWQVRIGNCGNGLRVVSHCVKY